MTASGAETTFEDRCIGCLLGTACGDILGAGVEGGSAREIRETHGELRDFLKSDRGFGCYTDDTQMTVALATSLVECGRVDAEHVSAKYAEFYEPWRGYGGAAHRVMQVLQRGADFRGTGRLQFPDGSFGNGGAMRIAPVGLAYRHAPPEILHAAVADARGPFRMTPPPPASSPDHIKFLREEIRYENQQIANRVNYLSAVQSFLFVACAISNSPNNGFWFFAKWVIPLLGMLTSALALAGIVAAWVQ